MHAITYPFNLAGCHVRVRDPLEFKLLYRQTPDAPLVIVSDPLLSRPSSQGPRIVIFKNVAGYYGVSHAERFDVVDDLSLPLEEQVTYADSYPLNLKGCILKPACKGFANALTASPNWLSR